MNRPAKKPQARAVATRERLLDAAEALFAAQEFDAVTIRDVANGAGAQLALIHYYFRSKEELFRQVLVRRVEELSKRRLGMLATFRAAAGKKPIPIEQIVEALIYPLLEFSLNGGDGWKYYVRLNGRVATSEKYLRMAEGLYDPVAQIFMEELRRSLPKASRTDIEWAFFFMVAAMSGGFSESGRIERLSDGRQKSSDLEVAYKVMIPFITAGLRSISG